MRRMMMLDFAAMRHTIVQLVAIAAVIVVFLTISTGSALVGASGASAMMLYSYLATVFAYDESAGWERLRLSLPLSRRDVVLGRYASVLVVALGGFVFSVVVGLLVSMVAGAFYDGQTMPLDVGGSTVREQMLALTLAAGIVMVGMLPISSVVMPLYFKFGTTKAMRLVVLAAVMVFCAALASAGQFLPDASSGAAPLALPSLPLPLPAIAAIAVVGAFVLFAGSAAISIGLYKGKEL